MPLKYVAPNVRTCDYCGARSNIPKGLTAAEMRRRLKAIGWESKDFLVLCPRCASRKTMTKWGLSESVRAKAQTIPIIGRLFG